MCAIFGSFEPSMFEVLYQANKSRGNFASSVIAIGHEDTYIQKFEGDIPKSFEYVDDMVYITGHVQAPTSCKREWSYETSHPFESISWTICHNGVITNEQHLRQTYLPYIQNPVDSSLIANLLQLFVENQSVSNDNIDPVNAIKSTLTLLEGTFALSIIDSDTGELYIARCGSILHYDDKGNFSTIPGKGFKELPEGIIMRLDKAHIKWVQVATFETQSPFLFI
tara:strand:- start:10433 stop:11104 length:672 start_codon:yes stop_codon:yes gene_type:complete